MSEEIENKTDSKLNNLYWLLLAVLAVWFSSIFIVPLFYCNLADRGIFGDSFGAINSLFSGLAFAGIIYTILLQRKELKLQRDELELTRNELAKSAEAQIASQKELAKQSLNMKRTAELNALSTLIDSLNHQESVLRKNPKSVPDYTEKIDHLNSKKVDYIERVKEIMNIKSME